MIRLTDLEVIEFPQQSSGIVAQYILALARLRRADFSGMHFNGGSRLPSTEWKDEPALSLLSRLPHLEYLDIQNSRGLESKELAYLARSQSLVELDLSNCKSRLDFGVLSQGLPRLQILRINGTTADDAQLLELGNLPSLKQVEVRQTNVTPTGLKALESKRPDILIQSDAGDN